MTDDGSWPPTINAKLTSQICKVAVRPGGVSTALSRRSLILSKKRSRGVLTALMAFPRRTQGASTALYSSLRHWHSDTMALFQERGAARHSMRSLGDPTELARRWWRLHGVYLGVLDFSPHPYQYSETMIILVLALGLKLIPVWFKHICHTKSWTRPALTWIMQCPDFSFRIYIQ